MLSNRFRATPSGVLLGNFLERRLAELRRLYLPALRAIGLRAQVLTTAVARRIYRLLTTEMPMTPSPLVAPGGGGPTQDLPGPRGESPAIGGVGLDSFGPNPTANSVGAEEGGSSGARTTIQLGTDGVRHGARFPRRARGEGPPLHQPPHRTSAMALAGLRAKLWPMFVLQIVLPIMPVLLQYGLRVPSGCTGASTF